MTKHQQIINGVINLAKTERNLFEVSVQEIANNAGVKKTTIYDYFPNKEAIFQQTIQYLIQTQINELRLQIDNIPTFKQRLYVIFDFVSSNMENQLSLHNLLFSFSGKAGLLQRFATTQLKDNKLLGGLFELFRQTLAIGVSEGLFPVQSDYNYVRMVMFSSVAAVGRSTILRHIETDLDLAKQKELAYIMLIKALQ